MKDNTSFFINKFKLTNEQAIVYIWLKKQKINTDDETLCYWSITYSPVRVKEVVEFANARIASGQKILNIGGFIRNLFKTGSVVVNDTCKFNQEYALAFIKARNWSDLKVYEKYVRDTVTRDDLPLTISITDFKRFLERLYQKSQLYK